MPASSFEARLRELIGHDSANSFARRVGITESLLRKYLAGATPGIDKAEQIANATGVSLDWLVSERGSREREPSCAVEPREADLPAEFAAIPRLSVEASAGGGTVIEAEEPAGVLAFRSEWLRRMGISPRAARVLTAKGDSMEPTLRDGDVLLVDTSIHRVVDNAIYVVVLAGLVLVKRVQVRRDGALRLISDNALFEPEEIPPNEAADLHVAGRVMWFGRSI